MAEGWLTSTDVFNPLDAAVKVQQLEDMKRQNRLRAMAMKEYIQQQKNKEEVKNFMLDPSSIAALQQQQPRPGQMVPQGGPQGATPTAQPMPQNAPNNAPSAPNLGLNAQSGAMPTPQQQMQQTPQIDPNQQAMQSSLSKGLKVFKDLTQKANEAIKKDPIDYKTIGTINSMFQNNSDAQGLAKQVGYDKIELVPDEEKGIVTLGLTKNYSREELDALADKYKGEKGGDILRSLTPGAYKFNIDAKHDVMLPSFETISSNMGLLGEKNMTEEQLMDVALHSTDSNKKKQAQDILDLKQKRQVDLTKGKQDVKEDEMDPFNTWDEPTKEFWFDQYILRGEKPRFAYRDLKSWSQFSKEVAQYANKKKFGASDVGERQASYTALSRSLGNQQKVKGMMSGFVRNMNYQIDRLDSKLDKIGRLDARLLNVPLRQAKMLIKGSANESILNMYLTDISNDIGKISTGSSASIAELSAGAQERWVKIHDPNLPIKDMKEVLAETKHAGEMRIDSVNDELKSTQQQLRELGNTEDVPEEKETKKDKADWMKAMPSPKNYKDKIIEDDKGNRWKSDGITWRKI